MVIDISRLVGGICMEIEVLGGQRTKRKRYIVIIETNGNIQQAVIVAYDTKGMTWLVKKLYGHLLIDENGNDIGRITFEEIELG